MESFSFIFLEIVGVALLAPNAHAGDRFASQAHPSTDYRQMGLCGLNAHFIQTNSL